MPKAADLPMQRVWVKDQLERAKVPEDYQKMIQRLLEIMWFYEMNDGLDVATSSKIVRTFAELAQGHTLVADEPGAVWVQAKPGMLVIRDRVRVRSDAYSGTTGRDHNGREGNIVAIRSGDIHVRYADSNGPTPETVRHAPQALEKRIR